MYIASLRVKEKGLPTVINGKNIAIAVYKFGIGMLSAFVVAYKVEVETLSVQPDNPAWYWISEGQKDYELRHGTHHDIGTTVILHISDNYRDMLNPEELRKAINWQVVRADEKYFEETIDRNVAVWMKRSHAYIADISDLNPNVMMELGYMRWAREPWQPVIVLERAHTGVLLDPADLQGIIRMNYPASSGRHDVDEIAEALKQEFAKDESVQKLNRTKEGHYLSPLLLSRKFRVDDQTAKILAEAYITKASQ
jgi:hypothetical protein